MKHYLYHEASGVIRFTASGADDNEPPQEDGLTCIEIAAPLVGADWHVENGAVVAGALDLRTLEDRKAEKWAEIKAARAAAIDAPLATPYGSFDSDAAGRTNITDAVLMLQTLASLGQPSDIDFTLADNASVTLTVTQMVEVGLLLGAKVQAAHAQSRALRILIENAADAAALEGLSWT